MSWFQNLVVFYRSTVRALEKNVLSFKRRWRFYLNNNEAIENCIFRNDYNIWAPKSTYRFDHLVQKHLFPLFYFIRDYLLKFLYFSFYFAATIWMHVICPFHWMNYIAQTIFNLRNEHQSSKRMNHMHSDCFIKNNGNLSKLPEMVPNEVIKEKEMLLPKKMFKTILQTDCFLMLVRLL